MKKQLFFIAIFVILVLGTNAQYTKLLDFAGTTNGNNPYGTLIFDGAFLYGMTAGGGTYNYGTIFKIKPDGSSYTKILDFNNLNGSNPFGDLYYDGTYLYGMTYVGGTNDLGTIFRIKPDGTNNTVLYNFTGISGSFPDGSLISDGVYLYGMTELGGINAFGTIFKIKSDGSDFIKLIDFNDSNGRWPESSFFYDSLFIYGTTSGGGTNGMGTVFKIRTDGTGDTILLNFSGIMNGSLPDCNLISDGVFLYGMTQMGGTNNMGTVFKIKPDGSGYLKLLDFVGATNGSNPNGSLIFDGVFLYGMTEVGGANNMGTVFEIKPDGSDYIKLLDFDSINGKYPLGSLISDGAFLYGMTNYGGTNNDGVVFKLGKNASIKEINDNDKIVVYPVPAINYLTIESPQKSTIDILNIQGQTILHQQFQQGKTDIDVSGIAKGVYILRLYINDKAEMKKIVKE